MPNITDFPGGDILIVKLDALGDYLLFRNYIKWYRENRMNGQQKLWFIGHKANKQIAEYLDDEFIDRFIWIDKFRFVLDWRYRKAVVKEVSELNFQTVYHATFSRDFFSDYLIRVIPAGKKVGFTGDLNNIYRFQKSISDRFYTQLIDVGINTQFEFFKYGHLLDNASQVNKTATMPELRIGKKFPGPHLDNYILVNISASDPSRKWSRRKFKGLVGWLLNNTDKQVVLCGTAEDQKEALRIIRSLNSERVKNRVGKTNPLELGGLVQAADLLISNETGTVHLAAAMKIPVLCISNGNHYKRFHPYPDTVFGKAVYVYPEGVTEDPRSAGKKTYRNVNEVGVDQVRDKLASGWIADEILLPR